MKTLLIMRHAKSDWGQPGLSDHDRPLNRRGERDAPRMGRHLRRHDLVPDLVLSSTAMRACTTARETARAAGCAGDPILVESLYLASPRHCLAVLEGIGELIDGAVDPAVVMIVAHNPGMEELVTLLTGEEETFPTAAVAQVALNLPDWAGIAPHLGTLVTLWRPREIDTV